MIEPEDISRFKRELGTMIHKAGDDPAAFGQIYRLLDDARNWLPDAVTALREQGFSSADMAAELGIKPSSFRERFYRPTG